MTLAVSINKQEVKYKPELRQKCIEELSKMKRSSSMAYYILNDLLDSANRKKNSNGQIKFERLTLDRPNEFLNKQYANPWKSSRSASARYNPNQPTHFVTPINASPSRVKKPMREVICTDFYFEKIKRHQDYE